MKYQFMATFSDGSFFRQPEDDESKLKPGEKSSFYDFLEHSKGRELSTFVLLGERMASIDCASGIFAIDGVEYSPGDELPEGCEWIEGNPLHGVYFRRVIKALNSELCEVGERIAFCIGRDAKPGVKNFLAVY